MNAHLTEAQVNGFSDGTLDQAGRAAVVRHLEECAECRGEVSGTRGLLDAVAQLPKTIEPARDLWNGIRERIRTAGEPAVTARPSARPGLRPWHLAAAAVVALVVGLQFVELGPRNAWRVVSLAGTPRIGTAVVTGRGALQEGDWLETDAVSRARIAVGRIGHVEVRPSTRVRLLDARPAVHRLALARGAIYAQVDAPPRLFVVETPAGTAIDLGCAYVLEVDSVGNGSIRVTAGWVEFAWRGRRSVVPLGFTAVTRPGVGPGIPWAADAPAALRQALTVFDFAGGGAAAARAVLRHARSEDAVSVWHLLSRVDGPVRRDVYQRLTDLVPPPAGVTADAVLALEPDALERYWSTIRRIAWRREVLRGVREVDPRTGLAR